MTISDLKKMRLSYEKMRNDYLIQCAHLANVIKESLANAPESLLRDAIQETEEVRAGMMQEVKVVEAQIAKIDAVLANPSGEPIPQRRRRTRKG